jgi:diguanylate cyclase (GGDEF)-like protein
MIEHTFTNIRSKRSKILFFFTLIGLSCFIFFVVSFYLNRINNNLNREITDYLAEMNSHVANVIGMKVEHYTHSLELIADVLEDEENLHGSASLALLKKEAARIGVQRLSIILPNGDAKSSDGKESNLSERDYFISSFLYGNSVISNVLISIFSGNATIVYSTPIYQEGKIVAVLTGAQDVSRLKEIMDIDFLGEEGLYRLVDSNGIVLGESGNWDNAGTLNNLFDLVLGNKLKQLMEENVSGSFVYGDKNSVIIYYNKLPNNNWTLFSIVPTSVIKDKTQFIRKTITITVFSTVVIFLFIICFLCSEKRKNLLTDIAFIDPVTKGGNLYWFEQTLSTKVWNSPSDTYSLVAFDIENFKLLNESFGRVLGDKLLRYVYNTIQAQLKDGEIVSRCSSDNYSILLKSEPPDVMKIRLQQIVDEINSFDKVIVDKYYLIFTCGVYQINDRNLDWITIQDRAHIAYKKAKKIQTGNLHLAFFQDVDRLEMVRDKEFENRMEDALKNNEFEVYFQPKFELNNNRVVGAEALVRWNDPVRGIILPRDFIPLFERNGFIIKIDMFIFTEVCKKLRSWIDAGFVPIPISVNLSRSYLHSTTFLDVFNETRMKYDIPSHLFEFELTETVAFENMNQFLQVIEDIHRLGFSCSLDDFGSGYSSLNMLKEVPVDVLKLDKGFFDIQNSRDTKRGRVVIESVIELAKKLDMKTVSEGVESISQVNFLRDVKCDMVQGFVFAKPLSVYDFERLAYGQEITQQKDQKYTDTVITDIQE